MTMEEYMLRVEQFDFEVMELHRQRIRETVTDPAKVEALMPYYRYSCRRPLFHDEYLPALNRPNVTIVDCPAGIDRVTERGVVVDGHEYELDCIVYATGFEPEVTPLPRRLGHEVVGRGGRTIATKWADGEATLFGMMTAGFPNLFLMPCPGHQAVVTVNYTLLTEVAAEHIAATVAALDAQGVRVFDVTEEAEADWVGQILSANAKAAAAAPPGGVPCTPGSRMLFDDDGNMVILEPHAGSYGGGFGDYFGFRDLLAQWREKGDFAGLELDALAAVHAFGGRGEDLLAIVGVERSRQLRRRCRRARRTCRAYRPRGSCWRTCTDRSRRPRGSTRSTVGTRRRPSSRAASPAPRACRTRWCRSEANAAMPVCQSWYSSSEFVWASPCVRRRS